MRNPDPVSTIRDAIRHWSSLAVLADFAEQRHGYRNTDGGFGVTYPTDLDEYDRVVDAIQIPDGLVLVCGFGGPPDGYEILVPEALYLHTLADVLAAAGLPSEAARVQLLYARQSG